MEAVRPSPLLALCPSASPRQALLGAGPSGEATRPSSVRFTCAALMEQSSEAAGWLWARPLGLLFSLIVYLLLIQGLPSMAEGDGLVSVDYEVFGKVQAVFFRKYTQAQGKKLGVVGWVQNTDYGTVKGQIQGPIVKVQQLQEWLQQTGSPKSHIDRAEFRNEKKIARLDYSDFCIVK